MSHASVTSVSPHSARVTEAVPARPLLVVETVDHPAGSTVQHTYTHATDAARIIGTPRFTYCAQSTPTDNVQLTYTYRAQAAPAAAPPFTFCALSTATGNSGAGTAAHVAVAGDAVAGSWI